MRLSSKSACSPAESAEPPFAAATTLRGLLKRCMSDEAGATAVEYGLLVALISLAIAASIEGIGGGISGVATKLTTALAAM